jgi:hypothetical protein
MPKGSALRTLNLMYWISIFTDNKELRQKEMEVTLDKRIEYLYI